MAEKSLLFGGGCYSTADCCNCPRRTGQPHSAVLIANPNTANVLAQVPTLASVKSPDSIESSDRSCPESATYSKLRCPRAPFSPSTTVYVRYTLENHSPNPPEHLVSGRGCLIEARPLRLPTKPPRLWPSGINAKH